VHAHVQKLVSVVIIATALEEYTTENQSSVVRFLWAKRLNAQVIHKEIFPAYVVKYLSCKAVHNWVEKFSQRRSKIAGDAKVADDTRLVRPVEIVTEATVQRAEELIRADRSITIDSVATALGCSHSLAYSIILCYGIMIFLIYLSTQQFYNEQINTTVLVD
jgi:hypothetical protein